MKSKKISIIAGVIFIAILIIATIYSRNYYQKQLPKVDIAISKSGTLNIEDKKEGFKYTVPLKALHKDQNDRNYVLMVKEQKGAWGKEYICESKFVVVLKKGESQVALKKGRNFASNFQ